MLSVLKVWFLQSILVFVNECVQVLGKRRREVFERYHFVGFMQVPVDIDIDFGT